MTMKFTLKEYKVIKIIHLRIQQMNMKAILNAIE